MNKKTLNTSSACTVVLAIFLLSASASFAQHRAVNLTQGTKRAPYSDGIVAGNTLYVAGLQGTDSSGKFPPGGFGPQTRAVLENIQRVVKAAGFQMKDVVSVNVYLMSIHNFATMNSIYENFFPDPKPSRTTVQVAALSNGASIEISAIAVRPSLTHDSRHTAP
ncbi:MAG: RidA family protein [Acidobacteriota bacterium]|nr:RidA family protein [Acidobacteriota bacterium]